MCVPAPKGITSVVMCHDMDEFNELYRFCMVAVVGIISGHGLSVDEYFRNHPNKSKVALC